jgi:hypothetical protein
MAFVSMRYIQAAFVDYRKTQRDATGIRVANNGCKTRGARIMGQSTTRYSGTSIIRSDLSCKTRKILCAAIFLIIVVPLEQAFATASIANAVSAFCAPEPTMPDVGSCSACHSSTNNRGPNDLTAAGMWALSQTTYINYCPNANQPAPTPNPTPTPTPPTAPPPGMSPAPSPGMGMGVGGSMDDDDDDDEEEMEEEDDDDDDAAAPGSSLLRLLGR